MKSLASMLGIAKARAYGKGVRVWNGLRAGFFLTQEELQRIYTDEGFNHRGTAMRRHVEIWMHNGDAVREGGDCEDSAVWFECPRGLETVVLVRSEQCGGRCVLTIERADWPVLRALHGIQTELEGSA